MPPTCLTDCYPEDHCLSSLLADYQSAGGICRGSHADINFPGLFPISDQSCEFDTLECWCNFDDFLNNFCTYEEYLAANCPNDPVVVRGLCSQRTQELLRDRENCIIPIYSQKTSIFTTTYHLIRSMCDYSYFWYFSAVPFARRVNVNKKRSLNDVKNKNDDNEAHDVGARLIPIEEVFGENYYGEGSPQIARVPPLQNTKHRYPWICSLRSVGQQSSHSCAVTLLSRPPGPTVLVTSAHCVYICKNEEGRIVPNCCCPNVGPSLCSDTGVCGTNATTVEMTGADTEVICGEWDIANDNEEEYNVILQIEKITIHPDFNISRGEENSQFVAADIATLHVSDDNFEQQSRTHNINPACLPTQPISDTVSAVYSGWSTPPPLDYVTANAPEYLEVFGEFSKQWHYSMDIRKCEDPRNYPVTYNTHNIANASVPLTYPTDSYYPPGTVCSVEREGKFCPTSGESGSPLMVTDDEGRLVAEGINSFIKV